MTWIWVYLGLGAAALGWALRDDWSRAEFLDFRLQDKMLLAAAVVLCWPAFLLDPDTWR